MSKEDIVTPQIVWRKISELHKADYNARRATPQQRASLRECMEKFGWQGSYAVINVHPDRKDIIVSGHLRIDVWGKDLGHDECPCIECCLTEEEERELNIRLNKNGGEFDNDLLAAFFDREQLISFGFTGDEFAESFKDKNDIVPEVDNSEFEIPKMEARLYEHHDYIVFVFDQMHDYINVLNYFNVKKVDSSFSEKNKKIGIGRVIKGSELLKKIHSDNTEDVK